MAERPSVAESGWTAPAFTLPATDGESYSHSALAGKRGALVMFIRNHCSYVRAAGTCCGVLDQMEGDSSLLRERLLDAFEAGRQGASQN